MDHKPFVTAPRSALRDWVGTFGTNVALFAIGIITGVIAARMLGPQGRGEFAEILFWGNFVAQLGAFGLPSAVMLEAARFGDARRLLPTVLVISAIYAAFAVSGFALATHFGFTTTSAALTVFGAAYVPANIIGLALVSVDAGAQRFGLLNAMRMIPQAVYLLAMLLLSAIGLASAFAFAWAMLIGSALVPMVRATAAGRALLQRPDAVAARRLVFGGLQFYVTSVIAFLREAGDRLVILAVLDQTALGLYAVGLTIAGSAIHNVAGATTTILLPKVAATSDVTAQARQLATAASASLLITTLVNSAIAIASPVLIPLLFGTAFAGAVPVAVTLCLAQTARSAAEILSSGLRGLDDWKAMPYTAAIALTVFLPLGFVGARAYGPAAVAAALAVSNAVALLFALHRAMRLTALPASAFLVPPAWIVSPSSIRHRLSRP